MRRYLRMTLNGDWRPTLDSCDIQLGWGRGHLVDKITTASTQEVASSLLNNFDYLMLCQHTRLWEKH